MIGCSPSRERRTSSTDKTRPLPPTSSTEGDDDPRQANQQLGKTPRRLVLSAFCSAGLRPVFGPASLRASARSLSKGGVPSRSPSTPPRAGAGGFSFGSGPGNYSPKKRPPPFLTFDPRLGRISPTPSAGKIGGNPSAGEFRREKQAGKVRAGPARAFVAAILRSFLDGFYRGNRRRVVRGGRRS